MGKRATPLRVCALLPMMGVAHFPDRRLGAERHTRIVYMVAAELQGDSASFYRLP